MEKRIKLIRRWHSRENFPTPKRPWVYLSIFSVSIPWSSADKQSIASWSLQGLRHVQTKKRHGRLETGARNNAGTNIFVDSPYDSLSFLDIEHVINFLVFYRIIFVRLILMSKTGDDEIFSGPTWFTKMLWEVCHFRSAFQKLARSRDCRRDDGRVFSSGITCNETVRRASIRGHLNVKTAESGWFM